MDENTLLARFPAVLLPDLGRFRQRQGRFLSIFGRIIAGNQFLTHLCDHETGQPPTRSPKEIPAFDLVRVLNFGALPSVYQSTNPEEDLLAYCGDYLQEEIMAEGAVRKIESFSRFLQTAAIMDTELVNSEVDSVIGDETAVEAKSTENVAEKHLKGLRIFSEEIPLKNRVAVSLDPSPRRIGDIDVLPYGAFLDALWDGRL